jgi:hypothetical protein
MSAVDVIVQWRNRIEEVQLAAETALEEIDSVLGVVRSAAAGEPLAKRQRCDVLSNLGVVDNLYDTLVCADLGEATRAIAEAVESAVPACADGVGGKEGPNSPCADGVGGKEGPNSPCADGVGGKEGPNSPCADGGGEEEAIAHVSSHDI